MGITGKNDYENFNVKYSRVSGLGYTGPSMNTASTKERTESGWLSG